MRYLKYMMLIFAILFGSSHFVMATSYYVDKGVASNGNGTSWNAAWKSFANIDWSQIKPGDVLYISGGSNSKTYNESLNIQSGLSGTADSPILITKGADAGHSGTVVFDGAFNLDSGIYVDNNKYVIIRNLSFKNYIGTGAIHIDYAEAVTVDQCDFYVTGHGGVFIQRSTRSVISNNTIETQDNTERQTDGIYSQRNTANEYVGNHIVISNQNISPHCDGIQSFLDHDLEIHNNYIEQNNNKQYNAQGIYMTNSFGTFRVYNNVVYAPNTGNSLLTMAVYDQGDGTLIAHENTLVGSCWGSLWLKDVPKSQVNNNIFVSYSDNAWLMKLEGAVPPGANIHCNLYYAPNSGIVTTVDNAGKSWAEWKQLGYEEHGINEDPQFANIQNRDFSLLETSPAIDIGADLGAPFNMDKNDISRPQGNGWDLGAIEFGTTVTLKPRKPVNFRVITANYH